MADEPSITTDLSADDQAFAAFETQLDASVESAAPVAVVEPVDAPAPVERHPDGTFKPLGKPRHDPQARMLEATATAAAAKRERDEARADAARLQRELDTLKTPKPAPVAAPVAEDAEPDPTDTTKYPEGQFDRAFYKDQARYEARKEIRAQHEEQRQRFAQAETSRLIAERKQSYSTRMAAVFKADPQFIEKIAPEVTALRPFFDLEPGETPTAANAIAEVIIRSSIPDKFLVHFTEHLADLQRLSTLPPEDLYREMGKLEARLDAAVSPGPALEAPISQAKPVTKPLASTPSLADDVTASEDDPIEAFIEKGNRDERRRKSG